MLLILALPSGLNASPFQAVFVTDDDVAALGGHDGRKIHTFPTPIGAIKAHRLFYCELEQIYASFAQGR